MSKPTDAPPPRPATAERDAAIAEFASRYLAGPNEDLYAQMLLTICRLARDHARRGDVKLLHKSLAELRYGLKTFSPYAAARKVSIFGSARTPEGHPDYEAAVRFSKLIGERGWMVITGAGDGIMKAGHGGAGREASFGVAIRLPFEQRTNEIIAADAKLVNFKYFFTRKLMFIKEASAVVLFPGGFGTQDEGFEAMTLVQTGKAALVPIIMCEQRGGTYWPHWKRYVEKELLEKGMISPEDMNLFFVTDDPDRAVAEVLRFYEVYHSARYVGDDLILRLNRPIGHNTLMKINDEFSRKFLVSGSIEPCPPQPAENGELPDLPRLKLHFDKRSVGLLRRMIDEINRDPGAA